MFRATTLLSSILIGIIASQTYAAPYNYSEAVSGDIPNKFIPSLSPEFPFDIGVNTVTGTFGVDAAALYDSDVFYFRTPAGTVLTSVDLQFTDSVGNPDWGNPLFDGIDVSFTSASLNMPSPGTYSYPNAPYLNNYFRFGFAGISTTTPGIIAYTASFTVIPEPACVSFIGLAAFALCNRRRKHV